MVNDCSCDELKCCLIGSARNIPVCRCEQSRRMKSSAILKKLALTVGIKAAGNDWLLLTDADCIPQSDKWIATMASNF